VISDTVCQGLKWQIHNDNFVKDFRLLRLGGCDMVLGMDWVDQFAPIQLHTRPLGISFHKDGKKVFFKGLTKRVMSKAAIGKQVKKWHKEGVQGFLVQCITLTSDVYEWEPQLYHTTSQNPYPELPHLLQEFHDLFQEPSSLLPKRTLDHTIPLIPGAKPINIGPYRYSYD